MEIATDYATITIPPATVAALANTGYEVEIHVSVDTTPAGIAVEIAVTANGTEITDLQAPITIAIPLEGLNNVNHHRIVALLEDGTLVGGSYDPQTGLFTFETQIVGDFEIQYVQTLNRLTIQMGSPFITDLAANAPLQTMDVLPVIGGGRTLLPVRFMAYSLGAEVAWNNDTRETTLLRNGVPLTFGVDGQITPELTALGMDVPAQIMDGRTMVPLRFISEYFGAVVSWDNATSTIEIISN
jgi:hypothetical protein